jgi:hypothetical protein
MTGFAENLPIAALENGGMDEFALSLYRIWRDHRGEPGLPRDLWKYSPQLILTAGEADEGDSPEILRVGHQTLFSSLCPEATDTENIAPKSLIDEQFRSTAHVGYHCAIDEGLSYQILSEHCYPRGVPTDITFERVICRWRLRSGLSHLTTYVKPLEILPRTSLANPWHELSCSPPSQDQRLLSPAQPSIVSLSGERLRSRMPADNAYSRHLAEPNNTSSLGSISAT